MPFPRRTDQVERWIAAGPAQVFSCWTDPALLMHCLPPRGMAGRIEVFEARAGRPFRMVLSYEDPGQGGKSGAGSDVIAGRFVAVEPPRHLAFVSRFDSDDPAFQGEMRMDWHFDPVEGGTRVRIIASDVPPGIGGEDHAAGMAASLAQLAALFE